MGITACTMAASMWNFTAQNDSLLSNGGLCVSSAEKFAVLAISIIAVRFGPRESGE